MAARLQLPGPDGNSTESDSAGTSADAVMIGSRPQGIELRWKPLTRATQLCEPGMVCIVSLSGRIDRKRHFAYEAPEYDRAVRNMKA
jgi:hypothetical protein